jgi:AAA+ ATPase superfamily predicted ATPase
LLFSTGPKDSIKDLFDREFEVEKLKNSLNERMILVLGLRRIGKSSLVLSTLNSLNINYIYIDVRKVYDDISKKVYGEKLYEETYLSLLKLSRKERVKDILRKAGLTLEYPIKLKFPIEEIRSNIIRIFEALNELGKTIIVFDEAQYLRYSTIGLKPILAHVYDYMKGITMIFTGSEVGLLYDFMGVDDPNSELYGRYYVTIELKPLSREKSKEFLREGFKELRINVDESILERAVLELDGIIGWLVYFGKLYLERGIDALDEVKALGAKMVKKELEEAFSRSPYYLYIMKAIATLGKARWKNIVSYIELQVGKRVTNATISRDLKNLIKMGFIEKEGNEYKITDPIVKYALLEEY